MSTAPTAERWAFFDCFAGISGDMTLGALMDLGLEVTDLERLLQDLGLTEVRLTSSRVTKEHLTGVKIAFQAGGPQPSRNYREICALISRAPLTEGVKDLSLQMFRLLGEAEARIHGQSLESVHFHELGALDTILDVVGVAYGVESLGITKVFFGDKPRSSRFCKPPSETTILYTSRAIKNLKASLNRLAISGFLGEGV